MKFLFSYFFVHFYYCWSINWYSICKLLGKIGFTLVISSKHFEIAITSMLHFSHFVLCSFVFLSIKWMVVVVFSLVRRWKIAVMPEYWLWHFHEVSKSPYLNCHNDRNLWFIYFEWLNLYIIFHTEGLVALCEFSLWVRFHTSEIESCIELVELNSIWDQIYVNRSQNPVL